MEEHGVTQTEHMATIEAHAVAQQVQQVHVATYTEHSMLSADEDSPSSPEDTSYDDSDILNSTAADEVTAHLAAAVLGIKPRASHILGKYSTTEQHPKPFITIFKPAPPTLACSMRVEFGVPYY